MKFFERRRIILKYMAITKIILLQRIANSRERNLFAVTVICIVTKNVIVHLDEHHIAVFSSDVIPTYRRNWSLYYLHCYCERHDVKFFLFFLMSIITRLSSNGSLEP